MNELILHCGIVPPLKNVFRTTSSVGAFLIFHYLFSTNSNIDILSCSIRPDLKIEEEDIATGQSEGNEIESGIPCEFCGELFPIDQILHHQVRAFSSQLTSIILSCFIVFAISLPNLCCKMFYRHEPGYLNYCIGGSALDYLEWAKIIQIAAAINVSS